jgi:hypothetical protein
MSNTNSRPSEQNVMVNNRFPNVPPPIKIGMFLPDEITYLIRRREKKKYLARLHHKCGKNTKPTKINEKKGDRERKLKKSRWN